MMRLLAILWGLTAAATASPWPSLEQLYTRPFLWGTPPSDAVWARHANVAGFLWNAEGRRFKDLYVYRPGQPKPVRLTDLERQSDELNLTPAQKDEWLKLYIPPEAGLSSFDLSDDGSRAAFSWKGDLYVVSTDGGSPALRLTHTKAPETLPQLSPDGKLLASLRGGQVHVQDLSNGQIWQITDVTGSELNTYRWSPDGKTIFYTTTRGSTRQLPLPLYSGRFVTTRQFERSVAGDEPDEFSLFLVGAKGGKPVALDAGTGGKGHLNFRGWSPDSKNLLAIVTTPDWKKKQIIVLKAAGGKGKTLAEESDPAWVDYGFADWSPDSQWVFFTGEKTGFAQLYKAPAGGGDVVPLTHGNYEIRNEPFTFPPQWKGDSVYYTSTEAGTAERQFYRIRPDGSGKERLSRAEGLNSGTVSDDGSHVLYLKASVKEPLDLWIDAERVTQSPKEGFYKLDWPATRFVSWPSRFDGKTVEAKLLLPPGYDPGKRGAAKIPAVFFIHGAGIATSVLKQWGSYNDLRFVYNAYLARQGYLVLDLDYRGSTGYGRDWRTGVYLDMGGPDLGDVLGGVDYLKSLGNVDLNRLGIWGVSYGGFMTNMALFRAPGVFRAGSSWAAVNNWDNYNAGYTAQRLNTPQRSPEAYRRSSPIWFSQNLKDHLLIIHGMVDDNVLFQDSVQLTEKLIHEGKEFSHTFYPEESHAFVRDESWIDALRRTTEWFDRYLK